MNSPFPRPTRLRGWAGRAGHAPRTTRRNRGSEDASLGSVRLRLTLEARCTLTPDSLTLERRATLETL
jgi:hypothetical protein